MIKVDDIIDNKNNIGKSVCRATFSLFHSFDACRLSPAAAVALAADADADIVALVALVDAEVMFLLLQPLCSSTKRMR